MRLPGQVAGTGSARGESLGDRGDDWVGKVSLNRVQGMMSW